MTIIISEWGCFARYNTDFKNGITIFLGLYLCFISKYPWLIFSFETWGTTPMLSEELEIFVIVRYLAILPMLAFWPNG